MTDATTEARFEILETKLAYAEAAVQELSDVVARQADRIDALEAAARELIERVANIAESAPKGSLLDEVPPHY